MDLMAFMEAMGTSNIPMLAAFFIGLMTAISPCPLTTNITAIAYTSKRIGNSKHTLLVGALYTLGRMATYILLAALIIWFGTNTQSIALFLQKYGEKTLGPLLLIVGIIMLDIIKFNFLKESNRLNKLKENLANKGFIGSFLLGAVFALAFCPFSAVLFFGMFIPIALHAGDWLVLPAIFGFATGLPVLIFSFILVYSATKLGTVIGKIQTFDKWFRKIAAITFILAGLYYLIALGI